MSRAEPLPDAQTPGRYGSGDGTAGASCPTRGQRRPSPRARYCSAACQQRAYRRRQRATREPGLLPALPPSRRGLRAPTIDECSSCTQRYLGVPRCADCQRFCRALGLGGACPHCDAPVLHVERVPA
jgi:hypothetical protein